MSTLKLPISGFVLEQAHANIDTLWGPYNSLPLALEAIPVSKRKAGFKFGVTSGNTIIEYTFETDGATTATECVSKKSDYYSKNDIDGKVGNMQNLTTEAKSTLVGAINELKQGLDGKASTSALTDGLAGKQGTINDLETIRSGAGKGATSVQGVKMEGDDEPLTPNGNGVVTIPQPEIPDSVTSVITNNELVFQTPDGQSVKGKVGIAMGADGLLHLTLTDEEGHTYSSPIAGLRVNGNALQYSNDGETWVTVQTFGKLAIKYAQASDPASGDEGDLALVGSTNAYVLKVYVGGSWVSVCDFGTLDLTSDGITIAGENKTLTDALNGLFVPVTSEQVAEMADQSLKLGIIGDSISTYNGWIPSGYAVYYPQGDVDSVDKTWWYKVAVALGLDPSTQVSNCSWSGSRVTGDAASTSSAACGCSTKRIADLANFKFGGNAPDIVICYISCNDWGNEVPLGDWVLADGKPTESTVSQASRGYALMLYKLKETYPHAKIFCCTNLDDVYRDETPGAPSDNGNGVTVEQWNTKIKYIASVLGCHIIDLHECGVNYSNIATTYNIDGLHPNAAGHQVMANFIVNHIKNSTKSIYVLQNTNYAVSHSSAIRMEGENKTLTQKMAGMLDNLYGSEDVDLDIADRNGYVIGRFSGGHIKTKYFDSRNVEMGSVSFRELYMCNIVNTGIDTSVYRLGQVFRISDDSIITLKNNSNNAILGLVAIGKESMMLDWSNDVIHNSGWVSTDIELDNANYNGNLAFVFFKTASGSSAITNEMVANAFSLTITKQKKLDFSKSLSAHVGAKAVAHRGIHVNDIPEDSLDAWRMAARCGMDVAEADVNVTSDGGFVMYHDTQLTSALVENADGTALSSSVTIASKTFNEIRSSYRLKSANPIYKKPLPSLEEYLLCCKQYGIYAFPELKGTWTNGQLQEMYEMCCEILGIGNFCIQADCSNNKPGMGYLDYIRGLDADVDLCYMYVDIRNSARFTSKTHSMLVESALSADLVKEYRANGSEVFDGTLVTPQTLSSVVQTYCYPNVITNTCGPNLRGKTGVHVSSEIGWGAFDTDGTVVDGRLVLTAGQYVAFCAPFVEIGGLILDVSFTGSLKVRSQQSSTSLGINKIVTTSADEYVQLIERPLVYRNCGAFLLKAQSATTIERLDFQFAEL